MLELLSREAQLNQLSEESHTWKLIQPQNQNGSERDQNDINIAEA